MDNIKFLLKIEILIRIIIEKQNGLYVYYTIITTVNKNV